LVTLLFLGGKWVNWFTGALHAVTHPGQLISDGEHWLGQATDQVAHDTGGVLSAVGLGQAASWVDGLGDKAAAALDPELQLGQTDDPAQLIHGNPAAIRQAASRLETFSQGFAQTSTGLDAIDTSDWTGAAADAFRERYAPQPKKWLDAAQASGETGQALGLYGDIVEWAQGQAREAIAVYAEGQQATAAAVTAYNNQVAAYNTQVQAYDAKVGAGIDPGGAPVRPGTFTDPGQSLRDQAQAILSQARESRDNAAASAASVAGQMAKLAPPEPGFWSQAGDDLSDANQASNLADESFTAGVLTGVADIAKLARTLNPYDPWNITHPAEYLAGASATLAGLVHIAVHPQELVTSLLSGSATDPAEWAGKLVPQIALTLATAGGGTAADAATDVTEDAAGDAAGSVARSQSEMPTAGDPVDVATGDVVLSQADVRLPGSLPLALERAHRSSYRGGRWFGRSWASTLDQRLVVTGQAVVLAAGDGSVLVYPRPGEDDVASLPVAGRPCQLRRDGDSYTVTDPQAGVVNRFEPRSGFYLSAAGDGELPLVSVAGRAGCLIRYEYAADGAPASVTYDGGYHVKVVTAAGRVRGLVLAQAGPDGEDVPLVAYGYDAAGDLAEVVNSSGLAQRFGYDDAGRMTSWTDRNGYAYRYIYDEHGRCVAGEAPDGTMSGSFAYDDGLTTYTDAAGAVTQYRVTPRGQLRAVTDPLGNVTLFDHDARGRMVSRTDALGRVTRWAYDTDGNLTEVTRPDGSVSVTAYDELGLPAAVTRAGDGYWRQDNDAGSRVVRQVSPDGAVTEFGYDQRGHLISVTGDDGSAVTIECNPAGLPVAVTGPGGARLRYERDAFGRVTAETGPDGSVTQLGWTVEGQMAARTFPDGSTEQFVYDGEGNLIAHADPVGGITRFGYGGFGQMVSQEWPDGSRSEFGYDHELRLTSVTYGGLSWLYERDAAGRLAAQTDYNGAVTGYARDAAGQMTSQVNAAGQQLQFAYDLLGKLTERTEGSRVTSFGYDAAGRLAWARSPDADLELKRDAAGRVTTETCNGRAMRSAYDTSGRRTRRLTPSGADSQWDYDAAGRPVALQAAGHQLRFGYDQAGHETLRELPGGLCLDQEWDAAGRLASQSLDGGRMQHRTYSYRDDGCLTGAGDLLSGQRGFTVDAAGRVTAVSGPGWAERYAYDPAGNVTNAAWPEPPGHASDLLDATARGSREHAGTLVTRAGRVRYEHDACGRIILRQVPRLSRKPDTWRYDWDADNRLRAVTTPDGTTWKYAYDPLGRRIAKQRLAADGEVAEQVIFTWDGPAIAEQALSAGPAGTPEVTTWDYKPGSFSPLTQTVRPARAGGDAPDQASPADTDAEFYAIVTDLIGAPAEMVSADGALAGYHQRTLWGAALWHPDGASTPLRFPGQYEDPETGLHYNCHRYYDPATGSYLSPDPLGLIPALNPHAYVRNPAILADPLGLDPASATANAPRIFTNLDPPGDPAIAFTSRSDPLPGYHDVLIHGNPINFVSPAGGPMTAQDLAGILRSDPAYPGGPVRLLTCSVGKLPFGPAQQLANQLGTEVLAPSDILNVYSDGRFEILNNGIGIRFFPDKPPVPFSPSDSLPAALTPTGPNPVINPSGPPGMAPPPSFGVPSPPPMTPPPSFGR
jgi:RHS repeat-associated protein